MLHKTPKKGKEREEKMGKEKLVLKDKTEITLETGASLDSLGAVFDSRGRMLATWEGLTEDNLSEVQIKDANGATVGRYSDLVLVSETSTVDRGGKVHTSFHIREKNDIEKRLDAVENSQEMVMGAIGDLGAVTSALAEAQEKQEGGEEIG